MGIKGITAYAPANNIDIDFTEITGASNLPRILNASKWYGFEIDLSAEATFFEFLHWKTVAGAFFPGGLYDIKNDELTRSTAGIIDPILFDNADIAFAFKTTLFFEF